MVDCTAAGYTRLPSNVPEQTLILRMDNNTLEMLRNDSVHAVAPHLQELYLRNSSLRALEAGALKGLQHLAVLDLSMNKLTTVPTGTLAGVPKLSSLILANNPIRDIGHGAFLPLVRLKRLDLSACGLVHLHDTTFDGLDSLRMLSVSNNQLRRLRLRTFRSMGGLMQLDLHGNFLHCDCTMRDMFSWTRRNLIGSSASPDCVAPPGVSGMKWENMVNDQFACPPKVRLRVLSADAAMLKLQCQAVSDPTPAIAWRHDGLPLNAVQLKYSVTFSGFLDRHSVLEVEASRVDYAGEFTCVATNPASTVNASLVVSQVALVSTTPLPVYVPAGLAAVIIACSFLVVVLCVCCVVVYLFKQRQCMAQKGQKRRQAKNRVKVELTLTAGDKDTELDVNSTPVPVLRDGSDRAREVHSLTSDRVAPSTPDVVPSHVDKNGSTNNAISRSPTELTNARARVRPKYQFAPLAGLHRTLDDQSVPDARPNRSYEYEQIYPVLRHLAGLRETDLDRPQSSASLPARHKLPLHCTETSL